MTHVALYTSVNDASFTGPPLSIAKGGTGASTAAEARANLGLDWLLSRSLQVPPTLHARFTGRDRRYYRYQLSGSNPIYSAVLADLGTLTRTTNKTYLDPQGRLRTATSGQATFHYPDLQAGGLQLDPVSTNLSLWSQDVGNAVWTKSSGLTVNATESLFIDNADVMNLVIPNAANQEHSFSQSHTVVASSLYTMSAFFRAGGGYNRCRMQLRGAAVIDSLIFDASTGTVITPPASTYFGVQRIRFAGNTYFRVWLGAVSTGTTLHTDFNILSASSNLVHTGNGTSGLRITGMELERYVMTRYIPTTTATVTRNEDVFTLDHTQAWFAGSRRFTIYSDVTVPIQNLSVVAATRRHLWSFRRVAGNLGIALYFIGRDLALVVTGATTTITPTLLSNAVALGINQRVRVALSFDGVSTVRWAIGSQSGTVSVSGAGTVDVSTCDEFNVGKQYAASDRALNGEYHEFAYWPEDLGLTTLGEMTR